MSCSIFGQKITLKSEIAVEVCPLKSSFCFCNDARGLIYNSRHVILSPRINSESFENFYSDTVLSINSNYVNSKELDSLLLIIDSMQGMNYKSYKLKGIKRTVNRVNRRAGIKERTDGEFYFVILEVEIDISINQTNKILIFNSEKIKDGNLFKEIDVVTGDILKVRLL